jgi:hypothetical protein
LGTNAARDYGVGIKVTLLDIAKSYRLPVPASFVLFDTAYRDALDIGLIRLDETGQRVITDRPDRLIASFNFPNFNWEFPSTVALRPAFGIVDQPDRAPLGQFASRLNVNAKESGELAAVLCAVWNSAFSFQGEGELRRDVLFMGMVETLIGGSAFTEVAYDDDLVCHRTPSTEDQWITLPKLGRWSRPDAGAPVWQVRLRTLLRNVRTHFNNRRTGFDWRIDWADDGKDCWILKIVPAAQSPLDVENENLPSRRLAK